MKSRHRGVGAADFGQFWIVDGDLNCVVGGGQFGMSLDDVQLWLGTQVER